MPMKRTISNISSASYAEADKRMGYKQSVRCIICMAKGRDGKPLRDEFDNFAINATNKECVDWLLNQGVQASSHVVDSHISKHAPYITLAKMNGSKKIQKMIVKIHQEKTQVSDALQRIIDIGDAKVQDGEMPVTEKLYIEALKEQGRRGAKTTMDTEFETMDDEFISKVKRLNNGESS